VTKLRGGTEASQGGSKIPVGNIRRIEKIGKKKKLGGDNVYERNTSVRGGLTDRVELGEGQKPNARFRNL